MRNISFLFTVLNLIDRNFTIFTKSLFILFNFLPLQNHPLLTSKYNNFPRK